MAEIVAVVVYRTRPDRAQEAISAFRRVMEPSHQEDGALTCALVQDNDDPTVLVLVERWASQEALDEHLAQPYVAAFAAEAEQLFTGPPQVHFLHDVPIGDPVKGRI